MSRNRGSSFRGSSIGGAGARPPSGRGGSPVGQLARLARPPAALAAGHDPRRAVDALASPGRTLSLACNPALPLLALLAAAGPILVPWRPADGGAARDRGQGK